MNDRREQLLTLYETRVDMPDSSGLEHLDLLLTRSVLANGSAQLNSTQKLRLAQQAAPFYRAIAQVADLKSWREQENAPADHWWWYLDVLLAAPVRLAA